MAELAYDYTFEDENYEIIEGEKFMAPAANIIHGTIIFKLGIIFSNYINKKGINAAVFADNTDIHFDSENLFMPDLSIVCNPDIIKEDAIYGAPDLIVEVLSRSTMTRDFGIKKNVYERSGVKEYWIIDPWSKRISVYHLVNGKFVLDNIYQIYPDNELKNLKENELASIKYDIKVSIFDDLLVDIHEVFKKWFE